MASHAYSRSNSSLLSSFFINGLFAMSELAVVSARRPLKTMAQRSEGEHAALALASDPGRFLSAAKLASRSSAWPAPDSALHSGDYMSPCSRISASPEPGQSPWALRPVALIHSSFAHHRRARAEAARAAQCRAHRSHRRPFATIGAGRRPHRLACRMPRAACVLFLMARLRRAASDGGRDQDPGGRSRDRRRPRPRRAR